MGTTERETALGPEEPCHYLPGRPMRLEYFFVSAVSADELDHLLSAGWRKFGAFYFRPSCPDCRQCVPLRVIADQLVPSESQARIVRRNEHTVVSVKPLEYSDEVFEVYRDHSAARFGKQVTPEELVASQYENSCPGLQVEYRIDGRLASVGFVDAGLESLSSVYFVWRQEYRRLAPGVYSVFAESALAAGLGMRWYYLGYWVSDNRSMSYKGRYFAHEILDWARGQWVRREAPVSGITQNTEPVGDDT